MQLISTGGIITAIRRIMERCQPRSREIMLGKKKTVETDENRKLVYAIHGDGCPRYIWQRVA